MNTVNTAFILQLYIFMFIVIWIIIDFNNYSINTITITSTEVLNK